MQKVKEWTEIISLALALMSMVFISIEALFSWWYSIEAERFYGIPQSYFFDNPIARLAIIIIFIILVLLMSFSPYIVKAIFNQSKLSEESSFIISILSSLVIVFVVYKVMTFIGAEGKKFYLALGLLFIFLLFVYFYVCNRDFGWKKNTSNSDENKSKDIKSTKINILDGIIITVSSVMYIIMVVVFPNTQAIHPFQKLDYEIIRVTEDSCKVIVTRYNNHFVVMEGCIVDNGKELRLKFGEYCVDSLEGKEIRYENFKSVKCER